MFDRRSIGAPVDEKEISVCKFPQLPIIDLELTINNPQTAKEEKAELDNYDAKVYKASAQMATALVSELKGLDIPFFALKQSLVLGDTPSETAEKGSPNVTKSELVDFQRKMLNLLEDLCKE